MVKRKKKIIITGGAGLVGLNFIIQENSKNYSIIIIDKNKVNLELAKSLNHNIRVVCADLSKNLESWETEFIGVDCVIQLQAQISHPSLDPYIDNNINSVRNILEVCKKYKIKNLIHLSSSVVISVAKDHYTNTKKAGEELVKDSNILYTILRPPLIYGCFDIKHIGKIMMLMGNKKIFPFPGNGKYIRQPLYVLDLVGVIFKLINKKPKNKTHNIIGKEKIYLIDMVKKISKLEGKNVLFVKLPIPVFVIIMKAYSFISGKNEFVSDQLKALIAGDIFPLEDWESEFNINYTPFEKGINKTVQSRYYKLRSSMGI